MVVPALLPPRPRRSSGAEHGPRRRPRFARAKDDDGGQGAVQAGSRQAGSPPGRRPPILLIVDDDSLMTQLLPRKMRSAFATELRILTAGTPDEAAALVRAERPDIVLCDYNLRAERTGIDVLADAAAVAPQSVRILFSGHTRGEIGEDGFGRARIHGFLEKPFRLDDLFDPFARLVRDASGLELERSAGSGGSAGRRSA
jgi:response regulator RpfG family c-di-GMP phosphodiesterase